MFSPQLSLLHADQAHFFQPFLFCQVLQSSNHLDGPLLNPFQFLNVSFELEGPRLDTVFQMWPNKCWGEWNYHVLWSAGCRLAEAAHDTICLHCCKSIRLAHIQAVIHQYSRVLLPPIILFHLWLHIIKAKHRSSQSFKKKRELLSSFYPKAQWLQHSPAVQETWFSSFLLLKSWTCVAHNPERCPWEEAVTSHNIFWGSFKLPCCHSDIFV